jgi:hypothetical protein
MEQVVYTPIGTMHSPYEQPQGAPLQSLPASAVIGAEVAAPAHYRVVLDSRGAFAAPPEVVWSPPLGPHTLENVGASEIRILSIELKDAPG